ncbi:MAG: hypothetical protein COT81_03750 [Candidatus Buchananbacteria bacterium CG10_big_fil_rev_8_21_14_0_10_42_9]|uniref:Uncharacterized protein n=1 Tax=Candidatus Buchananbacteria bacterium CG10_big_fil_rev_8_21_14_0_10_42_9 TaxID=1974526 RepID=A0A2H0W2U4_9BACT|nr:MAG: hypothetical protein COT81_03750 [Candidatus Buchananbacteria bacterium CG10_big_fil_rev_8_21_14_0_10_42_9]
MSKKNVILTLIIVINFVISGYLIYRNYDNGFTFPGLSPITSTFLRPDEAAQFFTPINGEVKKDFLTDEDYLNLQPYGYEIDYFIPTGSREPFAPFSELIVEP